MTEIWKSLEKCLAMRLRSAAFAPPETPRPLSMARDVPCVSAGSVRAAAAMASLSLASCATTVPGAMAQVCG